MQWLDPKLLLLLELQNHLTPNVDQGNRSTDGPFHVKSPKFFLRFNATIINLLQIWYASRFTYKCKNFEFHQNPTNIFRDNSL